VGLAIFLLLSFATIRLHPGFLTPPSSDVAWRVFLSRVFAAVCSGVALVLLGWHRPRVMRHLRAFFAEPEAPVNLAVFRIAVFAATLLTFTWEVNFQLAELPSDVFTVPSGFGWFADIAPRGPMTVRIVTGCFMAVCVAGLLGLFTPVATLLAALLGLYVLAIPQLYGKVNHYHYLLWFTCLLAVSPCGQALSVDALLRRAPRMGLNAAGRPSATLHWVWLLIGGFYFSAGAWKWLNVGVDWFSSDNMRLILIDKWLQREGWQALFRLDRYPLLYKSAALSILLFELLYLGLVLSRRWRVVAALGGLLFHWATYAFLKIHFLGIQLCYVCFINWRRPAAGVDSSNDSQVLGREPWQPSWVGRRTTMWVGTILFFGNLGACVADAHSWPFTAGPSFGYFTNRQQARVELVLELPGGERRVIPQKDFTSLLGPATVKMRVYRALTIRNRKQRAAAFKSLLSLVEREHHEVTRALKLSLYREVGEVAADFPPLRPVSRELVYHEDRSPLETGGK
jgi:hypothetical protein